MTTAALEYLKFQEDQRANRAKEAFNLQSLAESNRHNMITENISQQSIDEQIRSNQARERENIRHNVVTEGVSLNSLNESIRHNKMQEDNSRYATNLSAMGTNVRQAVAGKDAGVKPLVTAMGTWGDIARDLVTGKFATTVVGSLLK